MESAEDASYRLYSQAGEDLWVWRFFPWSWNVTLEVAKIEISKVILGTGTVQNMETFTETEQTVWLRARGH